MRELRLALAAALLLAGGVATQAKPQQRPFPQGVYGNVTMSRETGDLGGFEVRFYTDPVTGKPMAEFTLCEGWCNITYIAEVTRTEEGFAFTKSEMIERYNDDGVLVEQPHLTEYQVIPSGKGWKLRLLFDGDDVTAGETWRIKPLKESFGLDVARAMADTDEER